MALFVTIFLFDVTWLVGTINLIKNPILHSRTKHIKVRHHLIKDHVQNNDIILEFIPTENQIVDIFTKPLMKRDSMP